MKMSKSRISKNKKRIVWEEYSNEFKNYVISMMTTNIGSSLIELSKEFADDTASKILQLLRSDPIILEIKNKKYKAVKKPSYDPVHFNLLQLALFESDEQLDDIELVKEILESLDFKRTSNSQNLIILCAYFEAFLKQSILNLSKIDNIVFSKYIEGNKYDQLEKLLEISLKTNKEIQNAFDVIKEIFGIRNLYVHNNGIVDNNFIENTGNNKIPVGEKFPLDSSIVLSFYFLLYQSMLSIFINLSQKFFDITVKELRNLSYELK